MKDYDIYVCMIKGAVFPSHEDKGCGGVKQSNRSHRHQGNE
jgi:hypothetical protein